jgi:hypothetical protein
MTRLSIHDIHMKSRVMIAMFGLFAMFATAQAGAACMNSLMPLGKSATTANPPQLVPALYETNSRAEAQVLQASDWDEGNKSIVGLWEFQFDGFPPDFGTQAWHSDGTEIMFSGGPDPATGDVCQGVWRRIDKSTYTLNHIAFGYVDADHRLRIHFHATVTIDGTGDHYSGDYTADFYGVTPADPFLESDDNFLFSGGGTMSGNRVMPD